jgi:hypothetical protein
MIDPRITFPDFNILVHRLVYLIFIVIPLKFEDEDFIMDPESGIWYDKSLSETSSGYF